MTGAVVTQVLAEFMRVRRAALRPVLWALRSVGQGGVFAGSDEEYEAWTQLGALVGAEMLAVEASWPELVQERALMRRGSAQVLLSFTDTDARYYAAAEVRMTLTLMAAAWGAGLVSAVQMVIASDHPQQPADLQAATAEYWQGARGIPASVMCNIPARGTLSQASETHLSQALETHLPHAPR